MHFVRIQLQHFRNLQPLDLEVDSGINVLYGDNAQGKTNFLEALYLLGTLRSFRLARSEEMLAWQQASAMVTGSVERRGIRRTFRVELTAQGRRAAVDGKRPDSWLHYFGHLHVVLFCPDDLAITKGEPQMRRQFLDRAVFNSDPQHLENVRTYDQALRNRNSLLRNSSTVGSDREDLLVAFDESLVQSGALLCNLRAQYLSELKIFFRESFEEITASHVHADIQYRTNLDESVETVNGICTDDAIVARAVWAQRFRERLEQSRKSDWQRGYTTVGPHKDDLVFCIEGKPVRRFASQGQHRAFVLALKIAEIRFLQKRLQFRPVLLLDDVSSELDGARNEQLMRFLDQQGGQVFITTTDRRYIRLAAPAAHWQVSAGNICRTA